MDEKRVSDSETEQLRVVIYPDINGFGRLFGGRLLAWIDEVAGATARRHCGRDAATVSIDNLHFKAGDDGRPTKVPPLILENDGERMEWEDAKKRRDLRLMRKKKGF